MKLIRFRVKQFRSIEESEWIETGDVTAFIGTNESGKTNILVPLWKLNPAKDGQINPIQDYPRNKYHLIRVLENKPIFIEAEFELPNNLAEKISTLTTRSINEFNKVIVSRDYDGKYYFSFPNAEIKTYIDTSNIKKIIRDTEDAIAQIAATSTEETLKKAVTDKLVSVKEILDCSPDNTDAITLRNIKNKLSEIDTSKAPKRSLISARYGQAIDLLEGIISEFEKPSPSKVVVYGI
jgi:predicted ATP-dependent endonuclease of OLD family